LGVNDLYLLLFWLGFNGLKVDLLILFFFFIFFCLGGRLFYFGFININILFNPNLMETKGKYYFLKHNLKKGSGSNNIFFFL
jgi:hypothetical protein